MNRSRNRGLILLQLILEEILVAVITAIAIIVVMIIFGVLIGYREEIERRNIDTYVKVIGTPILILVTIYLYIRGSLGSDILLISMTWFLFVILNIDWKKVRTSQEVGNGNKTEKKKDH
jgi:predicted permease